MSVLLIDRRCGRPISDFGLLPQTPQASEPTAVKPTCRRMQHSSRKSSSLFFSERPVRILDLLQLVQQRLSVPAEPPGDLGNILADQVCAQRVSELRSVFLVVLDQRRDYPVRIAHHFLVGGKQRHHIVYESVFIVVPATQPVVVRTQLLRELCMKIVIPEISSPVAESR